MPKTKNAEEKQRSRLRTLIGVLRKRDIVHGMTPKKLRLILEDMGPTYVKLGQIMSMRSDILPQSYCDELQNRRTQVRPVEFKRVKEMMEEEWGRPISRLLDQIDETPLGSASIAQVYSAILKDTHQQVVIKVQRPGIYQMMSQDVKLIHKALSVMRFVGIRTDAVDFGAVIDEMWMVAQQEMNFLLEAEHIERFARLNSETAYVGCPKVLHRLTTSRVLVMEQINGIQIDQVDSLQKAGYEMSEIGLKLAENYVKQILDDAFFHADPHPGNLRIEGGKIVYLDLGMMGTLSERDRVLIRSAIEALVAENIHKLKDVLLTLGEPQAAIDHPALYEDLETMVRKYLSLEIGDIDLGKLITELMQLANNHRIRMPAAITMLARGLLTIEGVLCVCCPDVNMLRIISSHLAGEAFERFDLQRELKHMAQSSYKMVKRSMEIPVSLADLLEMAIKGQSKLNLEIVGSQEPLNRVDAMVNRIIACIFAASLLLGSSVICTTQMQPRIFGIPLIGLLGFLGAVVLGGWLMFDTMFSRRKNKK